MSRGDSYAGYRLRLVESVRERGIKDLLVLKAISEVPRHLFVPEALRERAYEDTSLPIGRGQTISAPSTHARTLAALGLTGREKVLEVGTGSGYQTALLAACASQVFSVERVKSLAEQARAAIAAAGCRNVSILIGDGTLGWRAYAPYDAIVVAAASPDVPAPLLEQLRPGGRILLPIGDRERQVLTLVTTGPDGAVVSREVVGDATFVPLLGTHGFDA
ncbi:MAG TPA: protein-L-isoaspartate(D-aspartate) O-methyltransferase [Gemmatimonadales bacterium]|nr:protein-L-isoaspartate(D-aspartate) O-methyltransferase [Gemmatimonadales bacterium]